MTLSKNPTRLLLASSFALLLAMAGCRTADPRPTEQAAAVVTHGTVRIDGVDVFYREAGPQDAPTILLLHGYPSSSHMFRNLLHELGDEFHLLAPDYPGFGRSAQPPMDRFDYTFDNLANVVEQFVAAKGVDRYSLYLMDYGAPIGLRLATRHPEQIDGLIVQNGAAYEEGLTSFWDPLRKYWREHDDATGKELEGFHAPDGLVWQYTHGTKDRESLVSPDNWEIDQRHLTRPGNNEIQLALFYDYRTNVELYPTFQRYFREHQPPALVVYGKNDVIFPEVGAHAYKRDLRDVDFHLYDTGHFALETHGAEIAAEIRAFMRRHFAG